MHHLHLVHWNAAETAERARRLETAGYEVTATAATGTAELRQVSLDRPVAIVIDLSRLPTQGRDVALALRQYKSLRRVPIVFVEGGADIRERLQRVLPDATFATWPRMGTAVKRAIARGVPEDAAAPSRLAGYSGTPLTKKLGIKEGSTVLLTGAPRGFEDTIGELPAGAKLRRRGRADLTIWFPGSATGLAAGVERMRDAMGREGIWIAWPKQASGVPTDLKEPVVRSIGLAAGLVDYKICAIDETWSALRFALRREKM